MSSMSSRLQVLDWAAGLGAVTADALAVREGSTVASARSVLAGAARAGWLERREPLRDHPALYVVTRSGLRSAGTAHLAVTRVTFSNARHLAVCAVTAALLARRHPEVRVQGERALRHEEASAGRPLASSRLGVGPHGDPQLHRPDLVLWPRDGQKPVAIEVELTIKAPRRLSAICRSWARCRLVAGVVYVAAEGADRAVARAVASTHAEDRVVVIPLRTFAPERTIPGAA